MFTLATPQPAAVPAPVSPARGRLAWATAATSLVLAFGWALTVVVTKELSDEPWVVGLALASVAGFAVVGAMITSRTDNASGGASSASRRPSASSSPVARTRRTRTTCSGAPCRCRPRSPVGDRGRGHGRGLGRYPQEVESAVYFCCLEALQNVAKYARASRATVTLHEADGLLRFTIVDDGSGFDAASVPRGTGLQGMTDRLDAIGGTLDVRSTQGAGTTVIGTVPVGRVREPESAGDPAVAS